MAQDFLLGKQITNTIVINVGSKERENAVLPAVMQLMSSILAKAAVQWAFQLGQVWSIGR
jgi:hypothetical protein